MDERAVVREEAEREHRQLAVLVGVLTYAVVGVLSSSFSSPSCRTPSSASCRPTPVNARSCGTNAIRTTRSPRAPRILNSSSGTAAELRRKQVCVQPSPARL